MSSLKKRFGALLAAHRKKRGLTQGALAEQASLSVDMISRLEAGNTGAGFSTIERLAEALEIDPVDLFSTNSAGKRFGPTFESLSAKLASLSENDLRWLNQVVEAALKPRR